MKAIGIVVLFLSLLSIAAAKRLTSELLTVYKKILTHANSVLNIDQRNLVTVEGIKTLMTFFDDDSRCDFACESYLKSLLGPGLSWDDFQILVDKIYGDQISDDPFQPQEVHLALTPDKKSMKVMWATMQGLEKPFAEYKLSADDDWKKSRTNVATSYTYSVPEKWWPVFTGLLYETDMTDLIPDVKYTYRVGGWDPVNATTRYSADFSFRAAPSVNPNRKTVIATMADHGTFMLFGFATVNKLVKLQDEIGLDMVFVAGDLSYAGLSSAFPPLNITQEDEFEHVWDLLLIQNQPIAANYPWMVGDGNHERFYNWTAFTNRFKMPQNGFGSTGNFWYDYDYGNVHWISISSEHDLSDGSPQKLFIEGSLQRATANRGNVPWIAASIHKPLYCSDEGTPGGYADLLEALFIQYDVDLVLSGHLHVYERSHPVQKGEVTVYPDQHKIAGVDVYYSTGKGPVHIVQGNTGAMQWERWVQPQPAWSAIRFANGFVAPNSTHTTVNGDSDAKMSIPHREGYNYTNTFGFGTITAWNSTHLHYNAYADTDSKLGTDNFWIVKRI